MPAAARITDMHSCPKVEPGPRPHVGGPVTAGDPTVLIGNQPAARQGDALQCAGPADKVTQGEPTVLIGDKPAARFGDSTAHGGSIVAGCPTVIIGMPPQAEALRTDQPVCEDCERKKQRKRRQQKGSGA